MPKPRPQTFVRIDQGAAQPVDLVIDRSLVIVQVYAPSLQAAFLLADELRTTMRSIDADCADVFGWVEQAGPQEWADPDLRDTARVQFTGHLYHDNRE
ncbi:hypothetical protein [Corynebacterium aquilae]|uniref:hypothetical protein n=1 Tax=Corynebacterium aquilae TaxID=203263 RepID=UPI0012EE42EB|nr:hypothetical protein [Corynebacterium aquilae]